MSRKSRKKHRHRDSGRDIVDPVRHAENVEALLGLTCVMVEAAGSMTRAERLGAFEDLSPEILEVLRSIVPPSRGGKSILPDAEIAWGELMIDVMQAPKGREAVALARRMFERREQELSASKEQPMNAASPQCISQQSSGR